MDNKKIEAIGESVVSLFPLVHRRLLRVKAPGCSSHPSNPQYKILGMLSYCGALPMSEIGRRLCISKPHMTSIINRLISERYVKRIPDLKDRRIIRISITSKGRIFLEEERKSIKINIKSNLEGLSAQDINKLYRSIETIKELLSKLDTGDK